MPSFRTRTDRVVSPGLMSAQISFVFCNKYCSYRQRGSIRDTFSQTSSTHVTKLHHFSVHITATANTLSVNRPTMCHLCRLCHIHQSARSTPTASAAFFHMPHALPSLKAVPHDPSKQPVTQGAENDTHFDGLLERRQDECRFWHPS